MWSSAGIRDATRLDYNQATTIRATLDRGSLVDAEANQTKDHYTHCDKNMCEGHDRPPNLPLINASISGILIGVADLPPCPCAA